LEYAHVKNIKWTVEQPANSILPLYKPLEDTPLHHIAVILVYYQMVVLHGAILNVVAWN
jgi:hypothetical protein